MGKVHMQAEYDEITNITVLQPTPILSQLR